MPLLRLLLTALLALVAMGAAVLAAIVMMLSGLSALLTGGRERGSVSADRRPGTAAAGRPGPNMTGAKGEVIDIESTPVREKSE